MESTAGSIADSEFGAIVAAAVITRDFLVREYWDKGGPHGLCVETSTICYHLFRDRFPDRTWTVAGGLFYRRFGETGCFHWWLTDGQVIVDLTADQFNDSHLEFPGVIVAKPDDVHYKVGGEPHQVSFVIPEPMRTIISKIRRLLGTVEIVVT